MTLDTYSFTTGPATLPAIANLFYNGCTFSPLFSTTVSGTAVKDAAQRTVKFMEYNIEVDGYVTLPDGAVDISPTMDVLRQTLTAQGGTLLYKGRGMDLTVNAAGGKVGNRLDVAWGPVPELLEFQPLGAGRSAKVKWQVKTRIPEIRAKTIGILASSGGGGAVASGIPGKAGAGFAVGGIAAIPLLQFNYETSVSYGEDGYCTISIKGTTEIPLTRTPSQRDRGVTNTVDDVRGIIDARIMSGIDLSRFRITRREFPVSRDKRTMEWSITAEEKPYMDLPPDCTLARGSFNVRPAKAGMGLCLWLCTLRASYTVRADRPRRTAWLAFLLLLRERMKQSIFARLAPPKEKPDTARGPTAPPSIFAANTTLTTFFMLNEYFNPTVREQNKPKRAAVSTTGPTNNAWLVDFSFDEGLYLDSKTVSFSATWRLVTQFSHIMIASGLWKKLAETDARGGNLWAISMQDVQGSQSWTTTKLDARADVIVDFGGG